MTATGADRRATPADAHAAQLTRRMLREELPRVRAAALSWRNALAGLVAGLVGFGLIRGRSEIDDLAAPWAAVVGILLLAALMAGGAGAVCLLSAAHGRPSIVPVDALNSEVVRTHAEALRAVRALRLGVVLVFACAGLLVAAVGVTWYGPPASGSLLDVQAPAGLVCGGVVRVHAGLLTLRTAVGDVDVDLRTVTAIQSVAACPASH
ncbi:hypothetical protein FF36_03589 [Frankia torreyi]|uniref:Uncharacterized protein n=1 Tax=Frankia torreyi TaxID=1856 RepID=A0A0D8BFE3_9ACTN|nr:MULTISPECIES: hypothetical protein [Frankia]KJE22157.1 hypothetical protein FF36_03589 [Frankia torreyi]KQC38113.1 hypothetical protein UK82_12420 [Frankia sp. ACN1ag]KQM04235.1 hypothetical protein FF86_10288 [Frankia sp. CpI1-P]